MRPVTVEASLVAARGRAVLDGVTRPALALDGAAVRFVTRDAIRMALGRLSVNAAVARRAADLERFGPVRKAAVAIRASAVSGIRRRVRDFRSMAGAADRRFVERAHEVMRLVTLLAPDAGVEAVVRGGDLVAGAARARAARGAGGRGMRVVAADAGSGRPLVRVVRVHTGVTARAGLRRAVRDVVRGMAAFARAVRRNARAAEDVQRVMAGRALDAARGIEGMRPVASDAFPMPAVEQRRFRYYRLLASVAFDTGRARYVRPGVLTLMTGDARLGNGVAAGRVLGRDVGVTRFARRGLRLGVVVRLMTRRTRLGVVHGDRRYVAAGGRMAAGAVAGPMNLGRRVRRLPPELDRERVATGTVGRRTRPELCPCLLFGMYELGFLGVAFAAALRHDRADRVGAEGVACRAFHLVSDDVDLVPVHRARRLPAQRHVDAASRRSGPAVVGSRTSAREPGDGKADQEQQREQAPFQLHHGHVIITGVPRGRDTRDLREVERSRNFMRRNLATRPARPPSSCGRAARAGTVRQP